MKFKIILIFFMSIILIAACDKGQRYKTGTEVKIKDQLRIYPMMYEADCIPFPSEEIKRKANPDAWSKDAFLTGQSAKVVSSSKHCSKEETVYIIESNGHYAPISEFGIE